MELKLYGGLQTQLTHQRSSIPQAAFEDNLAVAECMNGHAPNQGRLAVGRQAEEIRSVVNFPRPLQAAASFIPMIAGRVEIMFLFFVIGILESLEQYRNRYGMGKCVSVRL